MPEDVRKTLRFAEDPRYLVFRRIRKAFRDANSTCLDAASLDDERHAGVHAAALARCAHVKLVRSRTRAHIDPDQAIPLALAGLPERYGTSKCVAFHHGHR